MPTSELIEAYKSKHAFCCPTLGIIGSLTAEGKEIAEMFGRDSRVSGITAEEEQAKMSKCIGMGGNDQRRSTLMSVRQSKAAGIDIIWYVHGHWLDPSMLGAKPTPVSSRVD